MFESSSRPSRRANGDGSFNVFCYQCGDFIARTTIIMDNRALCELCRRVQNGETLTAEAIEQYKLGKMSLNGSISFVNMSQFQAQKKAEKGDKFTLRSLGGRIMHAIGLAPEPVAELESTKIAKQKRRLRIFSQGQLDQVVSSGTTSLGTMTGIDAEIRKKKEQG